MGYATMLHYKGIRMTNKQKKTLMLAGLILRFFETHKQNEQTKLHKILYAKMVKNARKQVARHGIKEVESVLVGDVEEVFNKVLEQTEKDCLTIEAGTAILYLYAIDEKGLSAHYGLSKGNIGKFCRPTRRDDRHDLENDSRTAVKMFKKEIFARYDIVEELTLWQRRGKENL